jgi:hypothetical protein
VEVITFEIFHRCWLTEVIVILTVLCSLNSVSTAAFLNHREREASSRTVKTGCASSCGSNEDRIAAESRDDVDTKTISRPRPFTLSSRNFSESSHLCDLRDEFATCELNKSVVRIEVCYRDLFLGCRSASIQCLI